MATDATVSLSLPIGLAVGMLNLAVKPRSVVLQPLIKAFHYHETNLPCALERILPSGMAHLMINLAEDQFRTYSGPDCRLDQSTRGAVFVGPHGHSTILDTREFHWLIAVEFRVGGAAPFLPVPLDELTNQAASLSEFWGLDGQLLREQLLDAPTPQQKLRLLESAMLQQFSVPTDSIIVQATNLLDSGLSVRDTATELGILPRTFIRRFREQIGLTPKRFMRIRRMQRVLRAAGLTERPDWCEVAGRLGFSDQAHLIHDFRELTGITPTAYKPQSPRRSNHVPITLPSR
jgi:AraC-like DNA-binding protein